MIQVKGHAPGVPTQPASTQQTRNRRSAGGNIRSSSAGRIAESSVDTAQKCESEMDVALEEVTVSEATLLVANHARGQLIPGKAAGGKDGRGGGGNESRVCSVAPSASGVSLESEMVSVTNKNIHFYIF